MKSFQFSLLSGQKELITLTKTYQGLLWVEIIDQLRVQEKKGRSLKGSEAGAT